MQQPLSIVGIALAKHVFNLVSMTKEGKVVLKKRLTRKALLPFIAQLSPVVIGMEACGGAHYCARRFPAQGHTVQLITPQFVKPPTLLKEFGVGTGKASSLDYYNREACCDYIFTVSVSTRHKAHLAGRGWLEHRYLTNL